MKTLTERFWAKVNKKGPLPKDKKALKCWPEIKGTRCYEWTGWTCQGYGMFIRSLAHRFAYLLYNGKHSLDGLAPDGKPWQVLHKCDNRKCVREEHLFKGTNRDNHIDKSAKGRNFLARGELCGNSILTNKDVLKIRKMYKTGKYTQRSLGTIFNLAHSTVGLIVRKVTWTHM